MLACYNGHNCPGRFDRSIDRLSIQPPGAAVSPARFAALEWSAWKGRVCVSKPAVVTPFFLLLPRRRRRGGEPKKKPSRHRSPECFRLQAPASCRQDYCARLGRDRLFGCPNGCKGLIEAGCGSRSGRSIVDSLYAPMRSIHYIREVRACATAEPFPTDCLRTPLHTSIGNRPTSTSPIS